MNHVYANSDAYDIKPCASGSACDAFDQPIAGNTLVAYPINNSTIGTDISQPTTTNFTLTAGHTYLIIVAANGTAASGLQFGAIVQANGTSIGTLQSSNLSGYNNATASTTITVLNVYAASHFNSTITIVEVAP